MRIYLVLRRLEIWCTLLVLCAVIGLIGWATVTRYLGVPNVWSIEVTQALFAWLCLLSASVALRSGAHFSIDLLAGRVPEAAAPWLGAARAAIMLALLVVLFRVSLDNVAVASRRHLPLSGLSFGLVAAAFPVACAFMIMTCLEVIVGAWRGAAARQRPRA